MLCIGDSITAGVGSSTRSGTYPDALERDLRERIGSESVVINAGNSGSDSRELLARLSMWMRTIQPSDVCVLIGRLDSWTVPELVLPDDPTANPESFPWRVRTWQLLSLAWTHAKRIEPTPRELLPRPIRAGKAQRELADELLREAGTARGSVEPARTAPQIAAVQSALEVSRTRLQSDPRFVASTLDQTIRTYHRVPMLRSRLVEASLAINEIDAAAAELEWLRSYLHEHDDPAAHAAYANGVLAFGRFEEAISVAEHAVARHPNLAEGWRVLGRAKFLRDKRESATAYLRFLELSTSCSAEQLARIGRSVAETRPEFAFHYIAAAALQAGGVHALGEHPETTGAIVPESHLSALLDRPGLDNASRRILLALRDKAYADTRVDHLDTLAEHLRLIVRLIRAHEARPWILTYPDTPKRLADTQREVAHELAAGFIPVHEEFERVLIRRPRESLFHTDGHCTDAGHALLARTVARALAGKPR